MYSTFKRSFVKGISWEFISFIITTAAIYYFYGDIILSMKFSLALSAIKIIFFFLHERAWKLTTWGKTNKKVFCG